MTAINTTLYGKQGAEAFELNPKTVASQVTVPASDGSDSTVADEIIKLRQQITAAVDAGIHFQGEVTSANPLPTVAYKKGWQYIVKQRGTYVGNSCEVGDLILCIRDYASGSASNADWTVLQANLDGVVTGPASSVAAHVAIFSGTSGKVLSDSGFTIAKNVPADAVFTDTTYLPATSQSDGLLTATGFNKLSGIEEGADKTDSANVKAAGAFMKTEDTTDDIAEGASNKFMSADEKTKLEGIASGAEVNQNALAKIKIGGTTIVASAKQDTFEMAAGTGITLTPDATTKKVTVTETYIDSCVVSDLGSVPGNLRDGGLIILKS